MRDFVFFLVLASSASAQVVFPAGVGAGEGNSLRGWAPSNGQRILWIDETRLGQPIPLVHTMSFRRDEANQGLGTPAMVDVEIFVGEGSCSAQSPVFANNYSTPRQLVFARKTVSLPDWQTAPGVGNGPAPFDMSFALDTPFSYSGNEGLVVEMAMESSGSAVVYFPDAHNSTFTTGTLQLLGTGCVFSGLGSPATMAGVGTSIPRAAQTLLALQFVAQSVGADDLGVVLVGASDPNAPVPGLCAPLRSSGEISLPLMSAGTFAGGTRGTWREVFARVPWLPILAGLPLYAQGVVLDPGRIGEIPLALTDGALMVMPLSNSGTHVRACEVVYTGPDPFLATTATGGSSLHSGIVFQLSNS